MKFKKILIGIDDNKYADYAAQHGFELAHQYKAEVALVHIVEPIVTVPSNDTGMIGALIPTVGFGSPDTEVENVQKDYSKKILADAIAQYGKGLVITQYNEFGSRAETIIDCATQFNADLIVIGTHSRTGFDRFLMGSIAEYVIRHSTVPVLVVPMKPDETEK